MSADYLPVGCFGKLPCYGDYLEGVAFSPTSRALKDWMLGWYHASDEKPPPETTARRLLYGLPGSSELVAGVIRPSADGASRPFPFLVFAHFTRRQFGKHYALVPMALVAMWEALDDAWDTLAGVATRASFEETLGSTLVPAPLPAGEARAAYENMQRESSERLFAAQGGGSLAELQKNMPRVLAQIRESKEGGPRVELPVSGGGSAACFDASFWTDLINRQFFWRRFEPAVFLEEKPGPKGHHVMLLFGALTVQDYPLLMGCAAPVPEVIRPAASAGDGSPSEPPGPGVLTFGELLRLRIGGDQ